MTEEIEIRKYHESDAKGVKVLIAKVLSDEYPAEAQAYPTEDLEDISSSYGKLGEAFFVAHLDGKIVGTVGVKQEDRRTALLRRLFVDATQRKKKLGGRLVDRAIEFSREVGYEELIFKTTSTMEDAVQLGEKKGFVPKARLNMGQIDLVKFALYLKEVPLKKR